jgi:Lar family restriction alleviation protein
MTDMRPCPFCGNAKVRIATSRDIDDIQHLYVKCDECHAQSGSLWSTDPCPLTYQEVRDNWNQRATDADYERLRGMEERVKGAATATFEVDAVHDHRGLHLRDADPEVLLLQGQRVALVPVPGGE